MAEEIIVNPVEQEEEGLSFMDILSLCIGKWYWIVTSLIICLIVAFLYVKVTPPTYLRTASILIKENQNGKPSSMDQLSEIGIVNTTMCGQQRRIV